MVTRRVGVLALQGGVAQHLRALAAAGFPAEPVRRPDELDALDGLVLPGGESTTHLRLIARAGLEEPLDRFVASGRPLLATCAGLILAAREVTAPRQPSFDWIDVTVARNGWGRQVASRVATADRDGTPLVFIRAPRITEVGAGVEVLARYRGEPVLVAQRNVVGATFHPELTDSTAVHELTFARTALAGA